MPPGDAQMVREIREGISTPVAMGDEQGGSYHPQALLKFDAVDFNRVDATTNGGITRLRPIVAAGRGPRQQLTTHMYPAHPLARCWERSGHTDCPIEWGIPGTGVHPDGRPARPARRCATGSWTRCPTCPVSASSSTRPGSPGSHQVTDPDGLLDDL